MHMGEEAGIWVYVCIFRYPRQITLVSRRQLENINHFPSKYPAQIMKKQGNPKKTWTTKAMSSPSERHVPVGGPGRELKDGPGGHGGSTGTVISTLQCTFLSQHPAMFKPQEKCLFLQRARKPLPLTCVICRTRSITTNSILFFCNQHEKPFLCS